MIYLVEREINEQQKIECPKDINLKIKNMDCSNKFFYHSSYLVNNNILCNKTTG